MGIGWPTIWGTRLGRKGEVGVRVLERNEWNEENLWKFESEEEMLRVGIKDSLRAQRAGDAIGGRLVALNIALLLSIFWMDSLYEYVKSLTLKSKPFFGVTGCFCPGFM